MRIAIDASRTTVQRQTGTEHYARQLIAHLIQHNDTLTTPHELRLYFRDVPPDDLFAASSHVTQRVIPFPRLWTHLRFAAALWRSPPDVTFVPAHTLPLAFPGRGVVTVHDLGYQYFPDAHPRTQRLYLDMTTRYSARRAARILADSRATADDLTRFYDIDPDKIHVVYPGVDAPVDASEGDIYSKYDLPEQYFLFIGTLQPRKNIARLVQAFDLWQQGHGQRNVGLVLAGKQGWLFDAAWTQGVDNVHITGYVDEADKAALMRHATALVFPSLYEGFGFPALEAMHCGTPVIASNASSLPELVGEAGILVNPLSVSALAAALDVLYKQHATRGELIARGYQQVQAFNWQTAAEQTLQVLEEAAL